MLSLAGLGQTTYTTAQVQQIVVNAANQYGVPTQIALGVASHESGFQATAQNPNSSAAGVMQLMAVTQKTMGVTNPYDPTQNINAGMQLLAQYYAQYGNWTTALYAYADGPGAVASPGYVPSAMAQQFASYVTSYNGSSILAALGITGGSGSASDDSDSGSVLGLSTDPASSSSLAQSLGVSDAQLGIGAAVLVGTVVLAMMV